MRSIFFGAAALLGLLIAPSLSFAQTADEIVTAADKVRNPGTPFSVLNTLTEFRSGKAQDSVSLTVYSKEDPATGQFRSLVKFNSPPRDLGKLFLKDGNILWFYDPASKASVRISPQERLLGQASNGDVLTVNYAKDYKAKIVGEETIQDADRQSRNCWKLDLAAGNDSVTYFRIEYWVEKSTYLGVKGKFYSDSGRLLKTAFYRKYTESLGGLRANEAIIIDGVDTNLVTKMDFATWTKREIPEVWFQRDNLSRLKLD